MRVIKSGSTRWNVYISCMGQNLISTLEDEHTTLSWKVGVQLPANATSYSSRTESLAVPLRKAQNPYNNYILQRDSAIRSYVFTRYRYVTPGSWLFGFIWFTIKNSKGRQKNYILQQCSMLRSLDQKCVANLQLKSQRHSVVINCTAVKHILIWYT